MYHIVSSTHIYEGHGCSGPVCDVAGVPHGKLYASKEEAQRDASKLSAVNPVGYVVVPAQSGDTQGVHNRQITVKCDNCGTNLIATEKYFGKKCKCSKCHNVVVVPWEGKLFNKEDNIIRHFAPFGQKQTGVRLLSEIVQQDTATAIERAGNWLASRELAAGTAGAIVLGMASEIDNAPHKRICQIVAGFLDYHDIHVRATLGRAICYLSEKVPESVYPIVEASINADWAHDYWVASAIKYLVPVDAGRARPLVIAALKVKLSKNVNDLGLEVIPMAAMDALVKLVCHLPETNFDLLVLACQQTKPRNYGLLVFKKLCSTNAELAQGFISRLLTHESSKVRENALWGTQYLDKDIGKILVEPLLMDNDAEVRKVAQQLYET